jgi:hypothetical protein
VVRRLIRSWPACLVPAGSGAIVAVLGLSCVIGLTGVATKVFYGLVTLFGGWMLWRAARGGLVVGSDGIEVRAELRTRFIPWREVEDFYVGGNWSIIPWSRLYVRTIGSEAVVAAYVASIGRWGPRLEDLAAELNTLRRNTP